MFPTRQLSPRTVNHTARLERGMIANGGWHLLPWEDVLAIDHRIRFQACLTERIDETDGWNCSTYY